MQRRIIRTYYENGPLFTSRILSSVETRFAMDGFVNKGHCRIRGDEDSRVIREKSPLRVIVTDCAFNEMERQRDKVPNSLFH